jgi:DNA gyrase subunit A
LASRPAKPAFGREWFVHGSVWKGWRVSNVEPLNPGRIESRELEQEMRSSFLDYAMSTIVARALPDVRDGLKPVHRRILFAMSELGLQPGRPRVKCARVVGEVMGNFHPHGGEAIYDTLVRLAQPFSLRYPLVDGQGNFGNIDGYPAAAQRYTECRLARMATELLRDIDADTVDFVPNYDESRKEPQVLPSRFPNLLVNGSAGIAVGMATNIPPHNLGEVIDGLVAMIDEPDIDVERLAKRIKGPDFPTGAIVLGREGIREAYRSGRGRIVVRARAHAEELRGGKSAIVVSELPYTVKKGGDEGVIAKIAELVKTGTLSEVTRIRDLSDKSGMRMQIELKRDAIPQVVLNKLYKHTQLQTTFGYNAVALVDGVPRTLSLLELCRHYLDFQRDVVVRRSKYELRKAEARAHVLEGYLIALTNLDAVIALIRAAEDTEEAREGLMREFELTETQAQAILELRLRALTALEQRRVEEEHKDMKERIAELRAILGDEARVLGIVREELLELKQMYGKNDDRRTEIMAAEGEFELEDLIAEEDMVIAITRSGYIKRLPVTTYREQRRGGKGVMGMDLKDEDYIEHLFVASTHDFILFFSTRGKVYRLKVHELPLGTRQSKGRAIVNLLPFTQDEQVKTVIRTRDFSEAKYLVLVTKKGIVKKTEFALYNTPLKSEGIIAVNLREGDELVDAFLTHGEDDILLVSRKGQAIRFANDAARAMGRATGGVIGMKLRPGDDVIAAMIADDTADLLVVTENGYGKRTRMSEYPRKGRGGLGVQTVRLTEAKGQLAGAQPVREGYQVMLISTGGQVIRMPTEGIRRTGRAAQGVIVMRLRKAEKVSSLAPVVEPENGDEPPTDAQAEPEATD